MSFIKSNGYPCLLFVLHRRLSLAPVLLARSVSNPAIVFIHLFNFRSFPCHSSNHSIPVLFFVLTVVLFVIGAGAPGAVGI